jgi:hypothetical protein
LKCHCKSYERIKKNRKRKEERKSKLEKGPEGTDSAQSRNEPAAQEATPNRYPFSFSHLADWWDPRVSTDTFFFLRTEIPPVTKPEHAVTPLFNSFNSPAVSSPRLRL